MSHSLNSIKSENYLSRTVGLIRFTNFFGTYLFQSEEKGGVRPQSIGGCVPLFGGLFCRVPKTNLITFPTEKHLGYDDNLPR